MAAQRAVSIKLKPPIKLIKATAATTIAFQELFSDSRDLIQFIMIISLLVQSQELFSGSPFSKCPSNYTNGHETY